MLNIGKDDTPSNYYFRVNFVQKLILTLVQTACPWGPVLPLSPRSPGEPGKPEGPVGPGCPRSPAGPENHMFT